MANVYSRQTKISNVVGRSDYISNEKRQEKIVLHSKSSEFDWKDYVDFEENNKRTDKANNQARELVIALPNKLADNENIKACCDELAINLLGSNRDYEYAVHWNKSHTNLHMHLLFSERERNKDLQPKVYKRDMYVDQKTGKTCKKDNPNAVLRIKKGDIQKDKDGNIKYNSDKFTVKDPKFKQKAWLEENQKIIQKTLGKYGYKLNIFDKNSNDIAQKKLYKGAKNDYLEYARNWNNQAKKINQINKTYRVLDKNHKKISPLMRKQSEREKVYEEAFSRKFRYENNQMNFVEKAGYNLFKIDIDKQVISDFEKHQKQIDKLKFKEFKSYPDFDRDYLRNLVDTKRELSRSEIKSKSELKRTNTIDKYKVYKKNLEEIEKLNKQYGNVKELDLGKFREYAKEKKALEDRQKGIIRKDRSRGRSM